jgi:purine-nucleoside phosphorylase
MVRATLIIWLLATTAALHGVETQPVAPAQAYVRTELFFGTTRNGQSIDAREWKNFLDSHITPAFPDGLTVVDAQGQWTNSKGALITEPSKVVVLIYPLGKEKAAAIKSIVEKYKTLYGQESVLEATAPVAADFHLETSKKDATPQRSPLDDYARFGDSPRENLPEGYIAYLKKTRFTKGELDSLPKCAVILFSSDVKAILKGLEETDVTELELGSATSNRLYVVRRNGAPAFAINLGLPGGGGIQTQIAELGALGFKHVVHVGTCAALSDTVRDGGLILSNGSYKDGAAVMLGGDAKSLSQPDKDFSAALKETFAQAKTEFSEGIGYTIPIYYFQPSGLIKALITGGDYGSGKPLYMEMEQAAFFETARRASVSVASLVVVSDRYAISDGKLTHTFADSVKPGLLKALEACRSAFLRMNENKK